MRMRHGYREKHTEKARQDPGNLPVTLDTNHNRACALARACCPTEHAAQNFAQCSTQNEVQHSTQSSAQNLTVHSSHPSHSSHSPRRRLISPTSQPRDSRQTPAQPATRLKPQPATHGATRDWHRGPGVHPKDCLEVRPKGGLQGDSKDDPRDDSEDDHKDDP